MANNKYRDRLEKKEPSPVLSFLHSAGKIAAIGGGIYGSYRTLKSTNAINKLMNSNAFQKTAEMARDRFYERKAYRSALKSTIQDVGFGRYMMGKGDDVLRTHLTRTMSDVAESKINRIGSTKTAFESLLGSTKKALTNAYELSISERRLQIINSAKKEYIKSDEANEFINKLIGERGRALQLSKSTYAIGDNPKSMQDQIQSMAENMGLDYKSIGDAAHAEIVKFSESAGIHLTKSKNDFIKDQQEQIQTILAKHKKNIYSSLYDSLSEINTATSKTMEALGAKRYTIGDFLSNPNMTSQRGNDSQAFIEALNSHSMDSILNRKEKLKNSLDFAEAVFADMRSVLQDSREEKIRQMAVDTSLFKDTAGNPLDLRFIGEAKDAFFDNASEAFQVPLVKIRPFQTIGLFNKRSPAGRDFFSIFRNGSYMPTLGSGPLQDDFYFFGDRAINSAGDVVFENARLAPKRGAWQRGYSAMFGATRHGDDERNFFMKAFDLGRQEDNNLLSGFNMWLNKSRDVNNSSTFVAAIENLKLVPSEEYTPFIYKKAYEIANRGTTNIDSETFDLLSKGMSHVDKDFQKILFGFSEDQTNEGIYNTLKTLTEKNLSAGFINSERMLQAYQNNPMGYDFQKNLKSIQMELLGIAKQSAGNYLDIVSIGSELYEKGQIGKTQLKNLSNIKAFMDLSISGDFQNPNTPVFGVKALNDIAGIFTKKPDLQFGETFQAIKSMAKEQDRFFSLESAPRRADAFEGNKHILVGKHRGLVKSINEGIKNGEGFFGVAKKLSDDGVFSQYWAGRKNPKNVTSTTIIPYYYLYRLNEGIASTGLALSNENMGSVGDIAKNLFTRRILGPAALITGVGYLNYEIGNLTGEEPSDVAAKAYAGTRLNFQRFKDITGINAFSRRWQKIMPGIDKTLGNPVGMALDAATGGFIGEDKGYEALKFEYEKGFSPVRKGRFWSFGSETPFYGGRVEFHEVPWIRKVIGEPENTEVLYGSEDRKWANSWLPNPRNPLGILKRIFDPYYIENGTRDIRPYPTTGGIPELEAVPLVGPLLNATVGRIIKPPRKKAGLGRAHREYLREINEAITAQQGGGSAFVKLGQGGRTSFVDISGGDFSEDIGQEYRGYGLPYRTIGAPGDQGMPFADISKNTISSSNVGYGAASSRQQLTAINLGIMSRAAVKQKPMTSISSLREAEYVANLEQAMDPNSAAYRLSETYYSMTEVGGIYGFLTQSVFGEMSPNIALADSSRIDSPQRKWWDRRMGGLGGDISEIYRRFLPNRRNSIEEYNPFKNKMPDWLPGNEYFIDYKHGDQFTKIPQGESLLPGAGYESVNDLNPDPFFNQYGALDRMKILGNAAPWSQQYKYYSKATSLLHQKGYLTDEQYKEAQYTREMVRERKKPFDIYPYKFKYADDIEKKTVTISRIIDDTTFLTKEMPYSPIRLAGVELPNKDTPEGEKIRAYLSSILQPEKKIRIGINKDPLNQERSDTMETIRAAVFDSWGDPIQKKLVALGAEGNFNDPSAATTNALFSPFEIGLGKTWEKFSHLDTPFHTKFLKIRSPLEHYKREYIYGKGFKKWSNPIRDWVIPTVENAATWNPLIASGFGAAIGAAASAVSPLSSFHSHSKLIGAAVGAMAFGIPSTLRALGEIEGTMAGKGIDATFIPRRRQKERDLDEYIDKLKYIKYKGLYEKAARLAQKYEGFNPKDMEDYSGEMKLPSKMRKQLQETLRWLKIGKSDSASMDKEEAQQKIDIINTLLDGGDDLLLKVGPYTARALQYKKEYESTLHGADPHGDLMAIYAAMPKKDRPFMQHFMTAPPEEREEILRLVPKNQRRFYQAKWGLKEDKPENLAKFFSSHHLPGPNWAGWKPNVSLESVKLKIAKNEAMDIRDMGFWEQDEREAENAPEVKKFNSLKGLNIFNLQKALEGAGLKNTDIQIIKEDIDGQNDELDLNLDIKYDRKKDIRREINNNISTIFA